MHRAFGLSRNTAQYIGGNCGFFCNFEALFCIVLTDVAKPANHG